MAGTGAAWGRGGGGGRSERGTFGRSAWCAGVLCGLAGIADRAPTWGWEAVGGAPAPLRPFARCSISPAAFALSAGDTTIVGRACDILPWTGLLFSGFPALSPDSEAVSPA